MKGGKDMNKRANELYEISFQLEEIARAEATNLWRIAREAERHGCSRALVDGLRNEEWAVWQARNSPHQLIDPIFYYRFKYAFRI